MNERTIDLPWPMRIISGMGAWISCTVDGEWLGERGVASVQCFDWNAVGKSMDRASPHISHCPIQAVASLRACQPANREGMLRETQSERRWASHVQSSCNAQRRSARRSYMDSTWYVQSMMGANDSELQVAHAPHGEAGLESPRTRHMIPEWVCMCVCGRETESIP